LTDLTCQLQHTSKNTWGLDRIKPRTPSSLVIVRRRQTHSTCGRARRPCLWASSPRISTSVNPSEVPPGAKSVLLARVGVPLQVRMSVGRLKYSCQLHDTCHQDKTLGNDAPHSTLSTPPQLRMCQVTVETGHHTTRILAGHTSPTLLAREWVELIPPLLAPHRV
jgi:hypothetical protein